MLNSAFTLLNGYLPGLLTRGFLVQLNTVFVLPVSGKTFS